MTNNDDIVDLEPDRPTPIYTSEPYEVHVTEFAEPLTLHGAHYFEGYVVYNATHNVVEYQTPQLAEAIGAAQHMAYALKHRPWEVMYQEVNPDGSPADGGKEVH